MPLQTTSPESTQHRLLVVHALMPTYSMQLMVLNLPYCWPQHGLWHHWTLSLTAAQLQLWCCGHGFVLDKVLPHRQEAVCPYGLALVTGCTGRCSIGVPQGSVLRPLLLAMCTSSIDAVAQSRSSSNMSTTLNFILPSHHRTPHLNLLLLNFVWPHYNFGSTQTVWP